MEDLNQSVNNLSEQTKKFNLAMFFTNGDEENAKKMMANMYKDMYVIKGKVTSSTLYGSFILFVNFIYCYLVDSYWVVSPDYNLDSMDNTLDWKIFEKNIDAARSGSDLVLANDFQEKISTAFTNPVVKKVYEYLQAGDTIKFSHLIQKILQESMGLQRADPYLEFQVISSLDMELYSISNKKLDLKVLAEKLQEEKEKKEQHEQEELEKKQNPIPEEGKNGIKLIVQCVLILSPVKGKHISQLEIGDRVMVSMIDITPQTAQIAKAFNAIDPESGSLKPVPARIKFIKYTDGAGYTMYAIIAKGIVARITEEENNIKIRMDPAMNIGQGTGKEDEEASKKSIPLIIVLLSLIVTAIIAAVLMIFSN